MSAQDEVRRFTPGPAITWTDNGGPLMLFNSDAGSYHALNAGASEIWRLVVQGESMANMVAALAARFNAPPESISTDVADFVAKALAGGLIVEVA